MDRQESIGRWISILYRQIHTFLNKKLRQYNLRASHIHVLKIVIRNDGINQEHISKMLHLDKANIGRAINKLMREGYIKRDIDPNDKRAYVLHITDKGKDFDTILRKILDQITDQLLSDFSNDDKKKAFEILKNMHRNFTSMESSNNK